METLVHHSCEAVFWPLAEPGSAFTMPSLPTLARVRIISGTGHRGLCQGPRTEYVDIVQKTANGIYVIGPRCLDQSGEAARLSVGRVSNLRCKQRPRAIFTLVPKQIYCCYCLGLISSRETFCALTECMRNGTAGHIITWDKTCVPSD